VGDVAGMQLIGGHPAIDFVNTLGGRKDVPDDEYLSGYADVVAWSERAGLVQPASGDALRATARRDPQAAEVAHAHAVRVRASIDRVVRAGERARVERGALEEIRAAYLDALAHAQLELDARRARFVWCPDSTAALDGPTWLVVVRTVDLLSSGQLAQLRECARCRWLFLDRSKNRSRRWCTMSSCGAITKMRRYRSRRARSDP
jgi:predicted RNA-binding Zn ribbon-like protein